MARPLKSGVDYFPLDVIMNDKVRLIEAEFGVIGFGILIKLYQKIYKDRGYYCEWNDEVALLFANDCKAGVNVVSEVLSALFRRGIFDRDIFEKYGVLTSEGIQRRYLEMVKRRQDSKIDDRYALVEHIQSEINVNNNGVNASNNGVNACRNAQIKGNKNKQNYSFARDARAKKESSFDVDDFFEAAVRRTYGE